MNTPERNSDAGGFVSTGWSLILRAQGSRADPQQRKECLKMIAENYWAPIHKYVLRRSKNEDNALDLTQAFFTVFLEKNYLDQARPERGKFRAFMLACVKNFLRNHADYCRAEKRAPKEQIFSLNASPGSTELGAWDVEDSSEPIDIEFMREWAHSVVSQALDQMEQWCGVDGNPDYWAVLQYDISVENGGGTRSYEEIAGELKWDVERVRKVLYRARNQFGLALRAVLRQSVETESEVEDELQDLRKYFVRA